MLLAQCADQNRHQFENVPSRPHYQVLTSFVVEDLIERHSHPSSLSRSILCHSMSVTECMTRIAYLPGTLRLGDCGVQIHHLREPGPARSRFQRRGVRVEEEENPGERPSARQQLVQNRSEAEDVRPRVERLTVRLFGRHIGGGPNHRAL